MRGDWTHKQLATWRKVEAMGATLSKAASREFGIQSIFPFQGFETLCTHTLIFVTNWESM